MAVQTFGTRSTLRCMCFLCQLTVNEMFALERGGGGLAGALPEPRHATFPRDGPSPPQTLLGLAASAAGEP